MDPRGVLGPRFGFRNFLRTRSGQMVDHRTDFREIKGLMNKTINARIDGLFEEGVPPFRDDEKDSWPVGLLDLGQQPLFFNPGTIRVQDEDPEMFFGKVRLDLVTAV